MRTIALLVALSDTTAAQDPSGPPLVTMATAQVKPDMTLEFEGLIRELRDANQESGREPLKCRHLLSGSTVAIGKQHTFALVSPALGS